MIIFPIVGFICGVIGMLSLLVFAINGETNVEYGTRFCLYLMYLVVNGFVFLKMTNYL